MTRFFWLPAVALIGLSACAAVERSAAKDPMKCERNPDCQARFDKSRDCATQCADDNACMDRCRQVTGQK